MIFLFAWRNALSSAEGPRRAQDRHVGHVLSLYMGRDGLGAWPSQETLAVRSGFTVRFVREALKRLYAEKWLTRQARKGPRGIRHPRWGFEYRARLPGKLADAYMNGERHSLFSGKEPRPPASKKNGERHDRRIGNDVPTNTSGELVKGFASREELEDESLKAATAGFNAKDKELLDRARRSIEQRRVKFAAAIDPKPHLQDLFWYELGLLRARGTGYGPSWVFLAIRVEWHGWDQVRQAGLEGKTRGLVGHDLDAFLRAYPFQPRKDAAGPPTADCSGSPEEVLQRIREKVARAPRLYAVDDSKPHRGLRYWAFACALLAYASGFDEKYVGALLGRLVAKVGWYGQVERAVQACEAKRIYGAPAIEFVRNYPFDVDQHDERAAGAGP
jgi:hypothetical protein